MLTAYFPRSYAPSALAVAAITLAAIGLVSCSYDGQLDAVSCERSADCPSDASCVDGYCVFEDNDATNGETFNVDEDCDSGEQPCGDQCIDTATDADHCGACFEACDDGEYCVDGACSSDCDTSDPEQALCSNSCVNPQTDPDHCGGCDEACEPFDGATAECIGGDCYYDCVDPGDDIELCRDQGQCANLAVDTDHCGQCGRQCGDVDGVDDVQCVLGECTYDCGSDTTYCSPEPADDDTGAGECIDIDSDPDHCGDCFQDCPDSGPDGSQPVCQSGQCDYECADGDAEFCSVDGQQQCVNTSDDIEHCGGCGVECPTDPAGSASCVDGQCELDCPDELTDCTDSCADLDSDDDHCGSCDNACGDDETCDGGQCIDLPDCDVDATPFGGGDGSASAPYLICTAEHLQNIDGDLDDLDARFELVDDLDLEGIDFDPIAPGQPDGFNNIVDTFQGHFNGLGHTIENLQIDTTAGRAGLFGAVGTGGLVEDVTVVDVDVSGGNWVGAIAGAIGGELRDIDLQEAQLTNTIAGDDLVGAITGYNQGTVHHSEATADVVGNDEVGGVAGRNSETLTALEATVDITANDEAGGIVGRNTGLVEDVEATADLDTTREAGTVAGYHSGTIDDAQASGAVLTSDRRAGGLVGRQSAGSITDSSSSTSVQSLGNTAGGLVGWLEGAGASVQNSTSTGDVEGQDYIGGLVGANAGTISASTADGDVDGTDRVGGLAGNNTGTIDDASATGAVGAAQAVGGLVGDNQGNIDSSHSTGMVTGTEDVGGLVGLQGDFEASGNIDGVISESHSASDVDATGRRIGGLVGHNWSTIERSYATGAVNADSSVDSDDTPEVGGLVGDLRGTATVTDCYAVGDVSGGEYIGGLVGRVRGQWPYIAELQTSYSTGAASGSSSIGGLIGANDGDVDDAYWNTDSSGLTDSDGGSGLDSSQFGDDQQFEGFDFGSIWEMNTDPDDERPLLQWQSN